MTTLLVRHGLLIIQRKVDRETRYGRRNWKLSKCRLNFDLMLKCLVCALEWQDVLRWKRWIGEIIDHHNWPKILVNLALEKFPSKQGWSSSKKQFGWLCAYAFFLVTWKCNNDRTFFCFYKYFCSACKRKFYVISAGGVNNIGSSVQGYSFHKFKSGFKYQCNITFYSYDF